MTSAKPVKLTTPLLYTLQLLVIAVLYFGALANAGLLSLGVGWLSGEHAAPTLDYYRDTLTNARVISATYTTLKLWVIVAVITVPTALLLSRLILALRSPMARLLVASIIMLPLLSSMILRMFGWGIILSDHGFLVSILCTVSQLGICTGVLYSLSAVVVGLVSNVLPLCTLVLLIQLLRIPVEEIMAARNLGASFWQIWWRIELPQCRGALMISLQLCLLFVVGDTVVQSILGGNTLYTYAAAMSDRVKIDNWPAAASMALLLVGTLSLLIVAVMTLLQREMVPVPQTRPETES